MVEVKCEYANFPSKNGKDFFIFINVEVIGHANNLDFTTNTKVCGGISACCYGIRRLVDYTQFNVECRKGYFRCHTEKRHQLKTSLDRDTVYALNTLVCQLYEIYCNYPKSFKSFELIDVKEQIENEQRERNENEWCGRNTED